MKEQIEQLLKDWHEAGRGYFESHYKNLDYDTDSPKRAIEKKKWVCLDEGTSGAFLLDKETCLIYRIKSAYGVPNYKKVVGKLGEVTGADLNSWRWR